jgi:hypothetical protein
VPGCKRGRRGSDAGGTELSAEASLGKINGMARPDHRMTAVRLILPLGWILAAVGFYGPWLAHPTAALTLSGVDMGEFIKFLPGVSDGTLTLTRQLFYLPAVAVVVSVALLISSRRLCYPWVVRLPTLLLVIPVSLQLLPPAWSPSSLMTPEFRLQVIAIGLCWLLLAASWLLERLPAWILGSLSAVLSLTALALSAWQFLAVKPAIDMVYGVRPTIGWGFLACAAGLAVMAVGSLMLVLLSARSRGRGPRAST